MQNIDGKFFAHFFCATSFHVVHAPRNGTMMGLVELRFEADSALKRRTIRTSSTLSLTYFEGEDTHGS